VEYGIEIENLGKEFIRRRHLREIALHPLTSESITALEDVSLEVRKGELLGILGPNGAGKTTLIKILATLILADKGRARVCGYDVAHEDLEVKRRMGLVTGEERSFYWRLSGRDNLGFFAALHGMRPGAMKNRLGSVMRIGELADRAHDPFNTYSAGMKQQLALARALIGDPEVLLVDEPTKSLDPVAAKRVRQLIREELVSHQGKTVLLATHNLEEANQVCDRIAILHRGKIRWMGTPAEMKRGMAPEDRYTLRVRNLEEGVLAGIKQQEGVISLSCKAHGVSGTSWVLELRIRDGETVLPFLLRILVESGASVLDVDHLDVPLEDVFARVVEEDSPGECPARGPRER